MTGKETKNLWKANLLEFFHNYFIGISYLECTEENCPLVDNWDEIEAKSSKKGLCALYKITSDNYLVVDAKVGSYTDLGTWEGIEITLPSGKVRKTKAMEEEIKNNLLKSGYHPDQKNEEPWLKDDEYVLFFNNKNHSANLNGADDYLEDLWDIKTKIRWDRDKSKKKVFLFTENEPSNEAEATKIDASNKDYLFYIADPSITNSIKNYEVYSPSRGTEERTRLYQDAKEEFSEMRRIFGIRHLTSKKEDRQNNPEIELNEAQFIALERRKKRIREKAIKEAAQKGFCNGEHTLTYGTAPEQRKEKVQEVKEIKDLETNTSPKPEEKGEPN